MERKAKILLAMMKNRIPYLNGTNKHLFRQISPSRTVSEAWNIGVILMEIKFLDNCSNPLPLFLQHLSDL